jgi:hypothetical protein
MDTPSSKQEIGNSARAYAACTVSEGYKPISLMSTESASQSGGPTGLGHALWFFDEEILEAATEVKQGPGEDGADALKHQKSRTGIDISVCLLFKRKTERN